MVLKTSFHERPHTPYLHPRVYAGMLGLVLLFAVAAWYGFASSRSVDFVLGVVSVFFIMSVALPLLAWRQWRNHPTRGPHHAPLDTYHDWADEDLDTFTGKTGGRAATVEILLPLGAVAFGMLAFAILTHVMS